MRLKTWTTILVIVVVAGALVAGAVPPLTADFANAHEFCDFITGGGWILLPPGVKANFGVAGGCKHGSFWGHLNYLDHGSTVDWPTPTRTTRPTPFHVHWTSITAYFWEGATVKDPKTHQLMGTRHICGTAWTNDPMHSSVYFHVRVQDNGEPGVNDTFKISLKDTMTGECCYNTEVQKLGGGGPGGGNIQLHKENPSTRGPDGGECNGA